MQSRTVPVSIDPARNLRVAHGPQRMPVASAGRPRIGFQILGQSWRIIERSLRSWDNPGRSLKDLSDLATSLPGSLKDLSDLALSLIFQFLPFSPEGLLDRVGETMARARSPQRHDFAPGPAPSTHRVSSHS